MATELFRAWVSPLTIANGSNVSRTVNMSEEGFDAEAYSIQAPIDIDGKTYTWEVSNTNIRYTVPLTASPTFATLIDTAGANVIVPGAGKAVCLNGILTGWGFFRLKASGATSQDVTFLIAKSFRS